MKRFSLVYIILMMLIIILANIVFFTVKTEIDYWSFASESFIFITFLLIFHNLSELKSNNTIHFILLAGFSFILVSMLMDTLNEVLEHPIFITTFFEDTPQVLGFACIFIAIKKWVKFNGAKTTKLTELSRIDSLTGLFLRRYFLELAQNEFDLYARKKQPFSILMLDLDFFKRVNDQFGHACGDKVLICFAQLMKESLRKTDVVARWGGEEFIVLLPNTRLKEAVEIAKLINMHTRNKKMACETNTITITVSIGVIEMHDEFEHLQTMITQADELLYQAKNNGRDRSEFALSN